jgi:hypothetical protein
MLVIAGSIGYAAWPVHLESGSGVGDYSDIETTMDGIISDAATVSGRVTQVETDVGVVSGRVTQVETDVGVVSNSWWQHVNPATYAHDAADVFVDDHNGYFWLAAGYEVHSLEAVLDIMASIMMRPLTATNDAPTLVTPRWIGDEYVVSGATSIIYRAFGTTTNDWIKVHP